MLFGNFAVSLRLLGTEFAATLGGLWVRAQKWIFMDIWENSFLLGICGDFRGICQVYIYIAVTSIGGQRIGEHLQKCPIL